MTGGARRPKFSVLLPTHNRPDVLPFAVRSVLAQTCGDFELLVVGDGCTDRTAEVVAAFDDPRVRWFDLPKAPHFGYANRNVALREAAGEFVAFQAHDDLWLPDHLELLAACLEESGAEIAYSRPAWVIPPGTVAPFTFNLNHPETLARFLARAESLLPAACVAHRRECFEKYGYWNEELPRSGDMDMWARIIEGGGRHNFAYLPEATCLHFRANWRSEADVPIQTRVWRALYALEEFAPAGLRVEVPEGLTEQETFWLAIEAEPEGWTRRLRAALHGVIDRRVALGDELILRLLLEGGDGLADPRGLLESYVRVEKVRRMEDELDEIRGSIGWKFTRRARRVVDAISPRGSKREALRLRMEKAFRRAL